MVLCSTRANKRDFNSELQPGRIYKGQEAVHIMPIRFPASNLGFPRANLNCTAPAYGLKTLLFLPDKCVRHRRYTRIYACSLAYLNPSNHRDVRPERMADCRCLCCSSTVLLFSCQYRPLHGASPSAITCSRRVNNCLAAAPFLSDEGVWWREYY